VDFIPTVSIVLMPLLLLFTVIGMRIHITVKTFLLIKPLIFSLAMISVWTQITNANLIFSARSKPLFKVINTILH
jgi:hypothetical protein